MGKSSKVIISFVLLYLSMFSMGCNSLWGQHIDIWEGSELDSKRVKLLPFIPEQGSGLAVVICPGGSYCWLDMDAEGKQCAEWLKSKGIAAFVLSYRTAGWGAYFTHYRTIFRGKQFPDMICDLQRAIQIIRKGAENYNVHPDKIGVMGFSAGGHLAMFSGVTATDYLEPLNIRSTTSLRPDFVASIYPVVTFRDEKYVHRKSVRGALGERGKSDIKMLDSLSLERLVPDDCPPVFLMNCKDDSVVKYQNSVMLDSALTAKNIPHKYIQYNTGGHGFGADHKKTTAEAGKWKEEFLKWLDSVF